jgi:hypothetical protein
MVNISSWDNGDNSRDNFIKIDKISERSESKKPILLYTVCDLILSIGKAPMGIIIKIDKVF